MDGQSFIISGCQAKAPLGMMGHLALVSDSMLHRFEDLLGIDLPVKITLWSPKRSDHQRAFNESRVIKWRSSTR